MTTLLTGAVLISIFHALIPSHWLPVLAISRQEKWSRAQTLKVTFLAGSAHVLSTAVIGLAVALLGNVMSREVEVFTRWVAPLVLSALGVLYLIRHYFHHHFHLQPVATASGIVWSLSLAMFFSPCLEIEGYFLAAGEHGAGFVLVLALTYALITLGGMLTWVLLAYAGLKRVDWHAWEHNAGLITGVVLILSGILLLILE